jgi:alpha-tubulin suppressor-like RCC1 family protein
MVLSCRRRPKQVGAEQADEADDGTSGVASRYCGARLDGTVECWGANDDGEATAPAGNFASVSAGRSHTCGVRSDGTVACWGVNDYGESTVPAGTFTSVSAGDSYTCGLRPNRRVECWGIQVRPPQD